MATIMPEPPITNEQIGELLALRAEEVDGQRQRAYRRAARAAFKWPEEAFDVIAAGRSPGDLRSIGPRLGALLRTWCDEPPEVPDPPSIRSDYISYARALRVVANAPEAWSNFKGDLQMHTVYSDGQEDVAMMAAGGAALGYEYIAVTDHSKGLKIANGMDEGRLAQQVAEIDELNRSAESGVRVLRSIEMNLNTKGFGDMDADVLSGLDLVLGSFHSSLRGKDDQTPRYLAAVRNPDIDTLGHPRGRMYNFRAGLNAQWERVFAEAARVGTAVEIDCYPDRQDLSIELIAVARDAGCHFSIGTDAHATWELDFLTMGAAAVVLAEVPPERVLNFMTADELLQWRREHRR